MSRSCEICKYHERQWHSGGIMNDMKCDYCDHPSLVKKMVTVDLIRCPIEENDERN